MKLSLNLLRQFTDITLDEAELLARISSRIGEIDSIERLGPKYEGIVVGVVTEAKPHADADTLGVYQVEIAKGSSVQVVAGDRSLKAGDRVAYIPPGMAVPATFNDAEPLVITKRDLRGQESNGMLASAKELDLGDDHSGVLVLDTNKPAGTPFAPIYELDDTVIEIENKALTHRPDTFGHIGFAREVAGIQQQPFKSPEWFMTALPLEVKAEGAEITVQAVNEAPELCNRLTLSVYSGVENKPSLLTMRSYLQRLGIRPLNGIVDITNYLMLVTGQPLHAFDYDKLAERSSGDVSIHARRAKQGERLSLLNGKTIELNPDDLVIATDKAPVALAGVMGGAETEVDEHTDKVVLEVANFNMYAIRNTSMRHGLFTEAVTRFSRGQDPAMCDRVQVKAAEMLAEQCDASVAAPLSDIFDSPRQPQGVVVEASKVNQLLGTQFSAEDMSQTLNNIEVDTVVHKDNLDVTAPTWRPDLSIAEDVVEEIGRLNGYDNIPVSRPRRDVVPVPISPIEKQRRKITSWLRYAGAHELLNYSGVSVSLLEHSGQKSEAAFTIKNALSPELQHMRLSLTPSILEKVYRNVRQGYDQFALFEVGTVHHKELTDKTLPEEQPTVAWGVFATKKAPLAGNETGAPYYQATYWLDQLLKHLGLVGYSLDALEENGRKTADDTWLATTAAPFEGKRSAKVVVDGKIVGVVGEYRAALRRSFKLPQVAAGFELHRDRLLAAQPANDKTVYRPLSRFPKVENDITLTTPANVSYAAVTDALSAGLQSDELQTEFELVDIYQAQDSTARNLTFRVRVWSSKRTLTSEEVNKVVDSAVEHVNQQCKTERV